MESIYSTFEQITLQLGYTVSQIRGSSRKEHIAWARKAIIYALREEGHTWDSISDCTHKDRSTCIKAHRVFSYANKYLKAVG